MRARLLVAILFCFVISCDGSGRLAAPDVGDARAGADTMAGDVVAADGAPGEDTAPLVPSLVPVMISPAPLADYGPAFWMEAEAGDDGLVDVQVRGRVLTDLVGFAVQVSWDPDLLELVEVAATAPLGDPAATAKGVAAGMGPGRLTLGVVRFPKEVDPWNPQATGVNVPGEVEMGRFTLRPIGPGDAILRFREGHRVARRSDYGEISCAWAGVQIRIAGLLNPKEAEGTP